MEETTDSDAKGSIALDPREHNSAESGSTLEIMLLNPNCPGDIQAEQTKVEEMNALVRSNPGKLGDLVKQTLASRFNKQGTYLEGEDRVTFGPSYIPFHTLYKLLCKNRKLCHLACVKNKQLANPYNYSRDLLSIARGAARHGFEETLKRLPFFVDSSDGDENTVTPYKVVQSTVELAQQICTQTGSLAECDLKTTESIAHSVNECLLDYALLVKCTVPQVKTKRSSYVVQTPGESKTNEESSVPVLAKDTHDDEDPEKLRKAKKSKKAKKKSKSKTNPASPRAEETEVSPLNKPYIDIDVPGEQTPQVRASASANSPSLRKEGLQEHDPNSGFSGFQTPKSTPKDSLTQGSSSQEMNNAISTASSGSLEQFYTPQESSPYSSRLGSPPTTPSTKRPRKARSILKRELLDEEIALGEESSGWEKTPEKDRANVIRSVTDILSHTTSRIQPGPSEAQYGHENTSVGDGLVPVLEKPMENVGSSLRQQASFKDSKQTIIAENSLTEGRPIPDASIEEHPSGSSGRLLRSSSSGGGPGISVHRNELPIEQRGVEGVRNCSGLSNSRRARSDKSPHKGRRNYAEWQDNQQQTLEHNHWPEKTSPSGSGPRGVAWVYHTNSAADMILREAFIFLWAKPKTYFQPLALRAVEVDGKLEMAPAIVLPNRIDNSREPRISWDGSTVQIRPHYPPWPDERSNPAHPDFLPLFKLAEYQACEVAGYHVWRHDREVLPCALRGCRANCSDFNPETRCCSGCGPKSVIRYCSFEHEIEDIGNHWRICGMSRLVLKRIVDYATAPACFEDVCPAIREMRGTRSFALHRQRHHACHAEGHYVLFNPTSGVPTILKWPRTDQKWQDMDGRIERLLNVVFLDAQRMKVLRYLYSLLRYLISISSTNSQEPLTILKSQFASEFGSSIFRTTNYDDVFPCECQWYGGRSYAKSHLRSCRWSPWNKPAGGSVWRDETDGGMQEEVSELESQYWILRAWAQQHATIHNWKKRAEGVGFAGDFTDNEIRYGPGFIGWGAKKDNICD